MPGAGWGPVTLDRASAAGRSSTGVRKGPARTTFRFRAPFASDRRRVGPPWAPRDWNLFRTQSPPTLGLWCPCDTGILRRPFTSEPQRSGVGTREKRPLFKWAGGFRQGPLKSVSTLLCDYLLFVFTLIFFFD